MSTPTTEQLGQHRYGNRVRRDISAKPMKQPLWIILAAFVISISSAANGTPGDILTAREDGVEVYDAPSSAAQILMTVEEGRKFKELRREGLWVKVIIYGEIGKDGWVHGSSVAPESAGTENVAKPDVSADESEEPAETSLGPQFIFAITGTPQQQFRARCQKIDHEGVRTSVRFEGRSPSTYTIEANAVRCRIHRLSRHAGTLGATLHQQGRSEPLGAAQTTATGGCIHIRSTARWGRALGRGNCMADGF